MEILFTEGNWHLIDENYARYLIYATESFNKPDATSALVLHKCKRKSYYYSPLSPYTPRCWEGRHHCAQCREEVPESIRTLFSLYNNKPWDEFCDFLII